MREPTVRRWIYEVDRKIGELIDKYHLPEDWWDRFPDRGLQRLTCGIYSHEPIPDQCTNPEHDFCGWCQKSMPFGATRQEERK